MIPQGTADQTRDRGVEHIAQLHQREQVLTTLDYTNREQQVLTMLAYTTREQQALTAMAYTARDRVQELDKGSYTFPG